MRFNRGIKASSDLGRGQRPGIEDQRPCAPTPWTAKAPGAEITGASKDRHPLQDMRAVRSALIRDSVRREARQRLSHGFGHKTVQKASTRRHRVVRGFGDRNM